MATTQGVKKANVESAIPYAEDLKSKLTTAQIETGVNTATTALANAATADAKATAAQADATSAKTVTDALPDAADVTTATTYANDLAGRKTAAEIEAGVNTAIANLPSQGFVTGFGNSIIRSTTLNSFVQWLCNASNGALTYTKNGGIGGNSTADMVARLSDIQGNVCVFMEATNDAAILPTPPTPAEHTANMEIIVDYCIENGIMPVLILAPPNDTSARTDLVYEYNISDYVMCRKKGVKCFSPWDAYTDPDGGAWTAGASDDGTHPVATTEVDVGIDLADMYTFNKFYQPLPRINASSYSNTLYQLSDNACFLTDTNGDGRPEEWTTNGAQLTTQLAPTSLGLGNTWITTWENSQIFLNSTRWNVTAGDRYLCVLRFKNTLNSGTCPIEVRVEYDVTVEGVGIQYMMNALSKSVDATTLAIEIDVPIGVSSLRYAITAPAGTFNTQIEIAQPQMYNLTHYGL